MYGNREDEQGILFKADSTATGGSEEHALDSRAK